MKLADTLKKLGEQADKNGLELDLDIAGDMAALKVVLAMMMMSMGMILMMTVMIWYLKLNPDMAILKIKMNKGNENDLEFDWLR